ncbi:tectonin domain-containing protein [Candidatus Riflebacteria bacterium]
MRTWLILLIFIIQLFPSNLFSEKIKLYGFDQHDKSFWSKEHKTRDKVSVWGPAHHYFVNDPNLIYFGQHAHPEFNTPGGKMTCFFAKKMRKELSMPMQFQDAWSTANGMRRHIDKFHEGSFWWPIADAGYVPLGGLAGYRGREPMGENKYRLRCVRADFATDGILTKRIWSDTGSGVKKDCSLWLIEPKYNDGVGLNFFYPHPGHEKPRVKVWVLKRTAIDTSGMTAAEKRFINHWKKIKPARPKLFPPNTQSPEGEFVKLNGAGIDISVGADGTAWCVGLDHAPYRWDGKKWKKYPGIISRIDVGPKGQPWGVNRYKAIFRWDLSKKKWIHVHGEALDVACGGPGEGTTYIVGSNKQVYRWEGGVNWTGLGNGNVKRIDVDQKGRPWIMNEAGVIAFYENNGWHALCHERGSEFACGSDGSIWMLGFDRYVYKWGGQIKVNGKLRGRQMVGGDGQGLHIGIDNKGLPWMIGMDMATYRRVR